MTCLINGIIHKWETISVARFNVNGTTTREVLRRCECGALRTIVSTYATVT